MLLKHNFKTIKLNQLETKVPIFQKDTLVNQIESELRANTKNYDTIDYIYLVEEDKLVGVFSIKELLSADPNQKVINIANNKVISAKIDTDLEEVALMALQKRIKAIPVVDINGNFLGIISSDQIREVLRKELLEDIYKMAGVYSHKTQIKIQTNLDKINIRIPWLIFGLLGGLLAGQVISIFESFIEKNVILVAFIPLITYMADATGTQSQTIFIRKLAVEKNFPKLKYLATELQISLVIGVILSLFLLIILLILQTDLIIAAIVSLSLLFTVNISSLIAILLPIFFKFFKLDPAVASGPFATIIRDVSSLIVYFSITYLLL